MGKSSRCGWGAVLLAVFLAVPASDATAAAAPKVAFGDQSISGSGFSPGGQVVWLGSARIVAEDYYLTLANFQAVTLADAGGAASYDLGKPLPSASVWVAVDLTTGAYSLATPGGTPARLADTPTLRVGSGVTSDLVQDPRPLVTALLVRPGQGAWQLTVSDGGPADEDGASDGHLQFSLANMLPLAAVTSSGTVASPPAPQKLAGQDLLVLLGNDHLDVSLLAPGVTP